MAKPARKRADPEAQAWARLRATLTLDPDELPDPLPAPGERDVLVCGASRSGTTLLSAMLFQPPRSISVMEPWDVFRLPPAEHFAAVRAELRDGVLRSGHLDVAALRRDGSVRTCTRREAHVDVQADEDCVVAIKVPILWRYMNRLPHTRFLVCVRDPREVIASFRRSPGDLAQGLDYDIPFNRVMNAALRAATGDPALRRVLLYDYVYERMLPHLQRPEVFVVRYERWFSDPDVLLGELGRFLGVSLASPLARVREPANRAPQPAADEEIERELIRACCRTAAALGYEL